jgi:amino acid transporter
MIMTPDKIGLTSGMINAIETVCDAGGIHWFVIIIALATLLFRVGSVNAWLLSPMVMFIEGSRDILPDWFTKTDEKTNTPKNALIVQAAVVSVLTLMAYSMPTAESAYWLMAAMATILYFIPFMAMFAAFIVLRKKYPNAPRRYKVPGGITIPVIGFLVVAISTILTCLPPTGVDVGEVVKYEVKLLGGGVIFVAIGYILYAVYKNRRKVDTKAKMEG